MWDEDKVNEQSMRMSEETEAEQYLKGRKVRKKKSIHSEKEGEEIKLDKHHNIKKRRVI